jgi:hypothetical protein
MNWTMVPEVKDDAAVVCSVRNAKTNVMIIIMF